MSNKVKKRLIGALVSLALAPAVSHDLISRTTADTVQTQADDALSDKRRAPSEQTPSDKPSAQNPDAPAQPGLPPTNSGSTEPAPRDGAPPPRR